MQSLALRAGRWPLALTLAILGACSDDTAGPTYTAPLRPNAAVGDVFLVTNTNDSGIGSLRWSLGFTTGGEIIRFDPSLGGQTIALDSTLRIDKAVTIEGPAPKGITLTTAGKGRVIQLYAAGTTTFRNLTLTGGNPGGAGVGGAIFAPYGTPDIVLENSVAYGNTSGAGTVIFGGKITLTNTTISGNFSSTDQPFEYAAVEGDKVVLTNSTVAYNASSGVAAYNGVATLHNSVISNNPGYNCLLQGSSATVTREGANLSDDDTCGGPSEIIIADPKLGALTNNGGPTMTHALLTGSPAINAGRSCTVQVDQRYSARDAQCDLGAYEFTAFTTVTLTIDPNAVVRQGGWAVLSGTVKCSRAESFKVALELHQPQRIGHETVDVHAASDVAVACGTTARPWSASMVLTDGSFQNGSATATAQTFEAEPWVAPASASAAVKLFWKK